MLEKTMLIKMNQQAYGTTMFQILSEDQIEQIYFAALDVLEISGARIFDKAALKKFESSAAVVTETDRVRVPTSLVEQALRGTVNVRSNSKKTRWLLVAGPTPPLYTTPRAQNVASAHLRMSRLPPG
jgi:hypothetical protein